MIRTVPPGQEREWRRRSRQATKDTPCPICLWYDGDGEKVCFNSLAFGFVTHENSGDVGVDWDDLTPLGDLPDGVYVVKNGRPVKVEGFACGADGLVGLDQASVITQDGKAILMAGCG